MMNYNNGKPNARYWVLKLIKDNFHPGDKLVETSIGGMGSASDAQAFVTPTGKKLLVVNKRNSAVELTLPSDVKSATISAIDQATGDGPARVSQQSGDKLKLDAVWSSRSHLAVRWSGQEKFRVRTTPPNVCALKPSLGLRALAINIVWLTVQRLLCADSFNDGSSCSAMRRQ